MEQSLDYRPRLRWPLDINQHETAGQRVLVLTDHSGVARSSIVVPAAIGPVLVRFDGEHTISQIVEEGKPYGITEELVFALIKDLNSFCYLDTEETRLRWEEIKEEYRRAPVREPSHAGLVYPANPKKLRETLTDYISKANGIAFHREHSERIVGLIAPHIDYERGGATYGASFSILDQVEKPDVIFLFGTAHQYSEGYFHLTNKDFVMPFGTIPVEQRIVDDIVRLYGHERCLNEEIVHRKEHSLELQMPFIAHRYREEGCPPIVPVLVGSFHKFLVEGQRPIHNNEIAEFVAALGQIVKDLRGSGKRFLFYGGVDLAHVGRHFGDNHRVSDDGLEEIERRDRQFLDIMTTPDLDMLFEHIAEDQDERRVCGFPSIYTMLSTMLFAGMTLQGHLIEYRQAVEPAADCIVTFASACWTEQG